MSNKEDSIKARWSSLIRFGSTALHSEEKLSQISTKLDMTIEHDISFGAQCRRPGSSFSALLFSVAVEIEYFLFSHSGTSASGDAGRNEIEFYRRFEWFTHLPVSEGRLLSWNIAATMCLRKTFGLFYILFGHSIKFPTFRVTMNRRAVVIVIHVESRDAHNAQHRTMSCNMAKNVARPFNNFFFKRGAITLKIHELIREKNEIKVVEFCNFFVSSQECSCFAACTFVVMLTLSLAVCWPSPKKNWLYKNV